MSADFVDERLRKPVISGVAAPPGRWRSRMGGMAALLGIFLCAGWTASGARAPAGEAVDTATGGVRPAETQLYRKVKEQLFRRLPAEYLENDVILDPNHRVSKIKASATSTTLPASPNPWRNTVTVQTPGGPFILPVPKEAEEIPGQYSTVWYYANLRIRLDVDVPELDRIYDWHEVLPREFHGPPGTPLREIDHLVRQVKSEFDQTAERNAFDLWCNIAVAGAEDIPLAKTFAERVAALYRLVRKATAPENMQPMRSGYIRCLVSMPVLRSSRHRLTEEPEERWVSTAILDRDGGALLRLTFTEPDGPNRMLTDELVLDILANSHWVDDVQTEIAAGTR